MHQELDTGNEAVRASFVEATSICDPSTVPILRKIFLQIPFAVRLMVYEYAPSRNPESNLSTRAESHTDTTFTTSESFSFERVPFARFPVRAIHSNEAKSYEPGKLITLPTSIIAVLISFASCTRCLQTLFIAYRRAVIDTLSFFRPVVSCGISRVDPTLIKNGKEMRDSDKLGGGLTYKRDVK